MFKVSTPEPGPHPARFPSRKSKVVVSKQGKSRLQRRLGNVCEAFCHQGRGRGLVPRGLDVASQHLALCWSTLVPNKQRRAPNVNRSRASRPASEYQGEYILIEALEGLGGLRSRDFQCYAKGSSLKSPHITQLPPSPRLETICDLPQAAPLGKHPSSNSRLMAAWAQAYYSRAT